MTRISGPAVGAVGAGAVFAYAALKGKSVLTLVQGMVQGKPPAQIAQANPVTDITGALADTAAGAAPAGTPGSGTGTVASGGSPKAILQATAASFGWTGAQWNDLDWLERAEAGYDTTARNPSSGAYGMAQSLGHPFSGGPAPNGVNEYGGEGLTPAQSRAASMGSAPEQALWMCRYIKDRYGTPSAAKAYHLANNSY